MPIIAREISEPTEAFLWNLNISVITDSTQYHWIQSHRLIGVFRNVEDNYSSMLITNQSEFQILEIQFDDTVWLMVNGIASLWLVHAGYVNGTLPSEEVLRTEVVKARSNKSILQYYAVPTMNKITRTFVQLSYSYTIDW